MLPRGQRLDRRLAERAQKTRTVSRSRYLALKALPADASGSTRIGVVVSKKTAPLAAARNRARRRLLSLAREHRTALPPGSYLVVVTALPPVREFGTLRAELAELLRPFLRR